MGCEFRVDFMLSALLAMSVGAICASAQAVELVTDDRKVTTFSDSGSTVTEPSAPFAPFSVSRQNSTVSNSAFSGNGNGYGESDFFFFIEESIFDITFDVTLPVDIDFSGFFTADSGDFGYSNVRVRLFDSADMSSAVYSDSVDSGFGYTEEPVAYSGTLPPGIYRLVLQTDITPGGFNTTGSWDFTANFSTNTSFDSDSDGIADVSDNCTLVANPDQRDTDGDGYGNVCDPDMDGSGVVNFIDAGIWAMFFGTSDADADFNGDGAANFLDYGLFIDYFMQPPGPSGIAP